MVASEQYPKGLGATIGPIADAATAAGAPRFEKLTFSFCADQACRNRITTVARPQVLLVGIESHVCVQQTVLDLLASGFRVYVATDALASRSDSDWRTALQRMDSAGATLTTVEAALFEWCEVAGTAEFKQVSALVRETPPGPAS